MADSHSDNLEPAAIDRLVQLIETLRGENGCPWDKEQTVSDVLPDLIGEAYELQWAFERHSRREVLDELGDVLFLICFTIGILGEEDGRITLESIAARAYDKIKRRHPHVFGDKKAANREESLTVWNDVKANEKKSQAPDDSALAGVPGNLSPIRRAETLQTFAARVGFDWPEVTGIIEKIREETGEIESAITGGRRDKIIEETGDLYFAAANLSRFLEIDGEQALDRANAKFSKRFRAMEKLIRSDGKALRDMTLEQMDEYWDRVKAGE
jgi:MazG family protein